MARMKVWVLFGLMSATSVLGTTAVLVAPAGADTACSVSASDLAIDAEEQQMLTLVNNYRVANGRGRLTFSADAVRASAWFARDMATTNRFPSADHVDSNGRTIDQRLSWCGVSYSSWAENIAAGPPDAQTVFDAWKASSIHNTNMLRDNVSLAGIGRAFGAGTTYGWYWVLDLASPPSTPVAIAGSTWYSDGTNARTGGTGATVSAYAVGAFVNVPYQMVLATAGCQTTVAVLNPTLRYANSKGFIGATVGATPAGIPAGPYVVCFRSTPDISSPTGTGTVAFTLQ